MNRKKGYYWVYFDGWMIAKWSEEFQRWFIPGEEMPFRDTDFRQIDERMIKRK